MMSSCRLHSLTNAQHHSRAFNSVTPNYIRDHSSGSRVSLCEKKNKTSTFHMNLVQPHLTRGQSGELIEKTKMYPVIYLELGRSLKPDSPRKIEDGDLRLIMMVY